MSRLKALILFRWKDASQNQYPLLLSSQFEQNSQYAQYFLDQARQMSGYQKTDTRMCGKQDGVQYFILTTLDGVTGVAITDQQYPENCGWVLVNRLIQDFKEYYRATPGDYENVNQDMNWQSLPYPNINDFFNNGQDPNQFYQLQGMQAKLEEVEKKQLESLDHLLKRGDNLQGMEAKTRKTSDHAKRVRDNSTKAKNEMVNQNQNCCICIPQKQGYTGLTYGYGISLVILGLNDLYYISSDSVFGGIITVVLHASYCYVIPLFLEFKNNEFMFKSREEDPQVDLKMMRMKLGGYFACASCFFAVFFSWYFIFQVALGAGYIYLVFVRYRSSGDEDDNYQFQADMEAGKAKMTQAGSKAMTKMHTPQGYDGY